MSQATLDLILSELRNFRKEVNEEFQAVRSELRTEFKEEIQSLRSEIKQDIHSLRSEVTQDIHSLRSEVTQDIHSLRSEVTQENQNLRSEFAQEFKTFKKDQQTIINRLNSQEKLYAQLVGMVKSIKETVTEIAERQDAQERKFSFELHTHATSIDILNREQLMLKTEIEMLKNRY